LGWRWEYVPEDGMDGEREERPTEREERAGADGETRRL
jgi:hypothetical protein